MKRKTSLLALILAIAFFASLPVFSFAEDDDDGSWKEDGRSQTPLVRDTEGQDDGAEWFDDEEGTKVVPIGDVHETSAFPTALSQEEITLPPPAPAQSMTQLQNMIQEETRRLETPTPEEEQWVRAVIESRNQMRIGAYAFIAARDLLGSSGKSLADLAEILDASTTQTMQLETRIRNREAFVRFVAGAPRQEVAELSDIVGKNQERLAQMTQIFSAASGDAEVRAVLRDQLERMTREQERLANFIHDQSDARGILEKLFGWLWR